MLINDEYTCTEYHYFTINERDKTREIASLDFFPHRIIHWALIQVAVDMFDKTFISQTYAALPGRGIKQALLKTKKYASQKDATYGLKIDVKQFFKSIDKDILCSKLRMRVKDKKILQLYQKIILGYPKSGIPIGNYTSQYLANFYLSDLDHYMKEKYHCKYYVRYMDDIVVLGWDKGWLRRVLGVLTKQLGMLSLQVKGNYQVFSVQGKGIDFVGYIIRGTHVLLRPKTKKRLFARCKEIRKSIKKGGMSLSDLSSLASYHGFLKLCNGFRLHCWTIYPLLHIPY